MKYNKLSPYTPWLLLGVLFFLSTACTAGDAKFADEAAGFWSGLWHGAISFITLVIHIFSDTVKVYETSNTGGWYDFGFLIGVALIWGHSSKHGYDKHKHGKNKEWEAISHKAAAKIMREIKKWAETGEPETAEGPSTGKELSDEEWEKILTKAETKLKKKIRKWADED